MSTIPSSSRKYAYPVLTKIAPLVLIPVFLFAIYFSSNADFTISLIIGGLLTAILLYLFFQMTGKITLDPSSLTFSRLFRKPVHLQWQEIDAISSNWTDTTIRLRDSFGERKIHFSLMMNGFEELVDQIYTNRPDLFRVQPGQAFGVSPLRWLQITLFAILFPLLLFVGVTTDSSQPPILGFIFLVILAGFAFRFIALQPSKIIFEQDILVIAHWFGSRKVSRNAILDVSLIITGGKSRYLGVRLDYVDAAAKKDKSINLHSIACGSPRLYGAIRSWAGITE